MVGAAAAAAMAAPIGRTAQAPAPTMRRARLRPSSARLITRAWPISLADRIGPGYGQRPRPSAGLMVLAGLMPLAWAISLADQIGGADGRARE